MNLGPLGARSSVSSQPDATYFDRIVAIWNRLFNAEHLTSGGHGAVSLRSLDLTALTPPTLTANTHNYSPTGLSAASYLRIASTGGINLTGLIAPSTTRVLWVRNVGAANITLTHEDTNSTAPYRFQLPNAASVTLGAGEGLQLLYDVTTQRWGTLQQ